MSITVDAAGSTIFSDDFEDGNINGWVQSGEDTEVTGQAAFTGAKGAQMSKDGRLRLEFDTTGYTQVTVAYDRKTVGLDSGEKLKLEYSINSGSSDSELTFTTDTSWSHDSIIFTF